MEYAKLNELLYEINMINYEDESRKELVRWLEKSVKFDLFKVIQMVFFLQNVHIRIVEPK